MDLDYHGGKLQPCLSSSIIGLCRVFRSVGKMAFRADLMVFVKFPDGVFDES